jgi:cytochrome c-type biogenesis protein CcmE
LKFAKVNRSAELEASYAFPAARLLTEDAFHGNITVHARYGGRGRMTDSISITGTKRRGKSAKKQTQFIVGGLIVVLVIGYLIFTSIQGSTAPYLTVTELQSRGSSVYERNVRVTGMIRGESIDWNAQDLILKFEIADEGGRLPVVYKGLRPDMFQDGAQAVLEGRYTEGGTFEAHNLMLKCPSKYEEAATATAQP